MIAAYPKIDAKGESLHACPTDSRYDFRKSLRGRASAKQRALDFLLEIAAEAGTLVFVPPLCCGVFEIRLPPERRSQFHFPPKGGGRRLIFSQETTSSGSASSS